MAWLIDQVLALIGSEVGSLAYHLVLIFTIIGTLQFALFQNSRQASPLNRRLILGLVLLLFLQLALFLMAGLAWQNLLSSRVWLPFWDRIFTILCLIIIIWLWAFPKPHPFWDGASLALGVIILFGSFLIAAWGTRIDAGGIFSLNAASQIPMNGSILDFILQIVLMALLFIGVLILVLYRPVCWEYGLAMMLLLAAGHIAHLLYLPYGEEYPAFARLFQLAAFPFLFILPQRVILQEGVEIPGALKVDEEIDLGGSEKLELPLEPGLMGINPRIIRSLLGLMENLTETQAWKQLASILAGVSGSDYVSFVSPPDRDGLIHVYCGYEKATQRFTDGASVDGRTLPILNSCLKMGRVRRMASSSTLPDRKSLAELSNLNHIGTVLFVPVLSADGRPICGAILIDEEDDKVWSTQEQATIGLFVKFLIFYLIQAREVSKNPKDLSLTRLSAFAVQEQEPGSDMEKQGQTELIMELNEQTSLEQASRLSMLVAEKAVLLETMEDLRLENQRLSQEVAFADERTAQSMKPLEGALRLTLEEISLLRAALPDDGDRSAEQTQMGGTNAPSSEKLETIRSVAEELHQPLLSIAGYTDALLGETEGELGKNQRKYLERIQLSTLRLSHLLNELFRISRFDLDPANIQKDKIDVVQVALNAASEVEGLIQERQIELRMNAPDQPLIINSDPGLLQEVLTASLRNAGLATASGGEISLSLSIDHSETALDYLLLQVSDRGRGIIASNLTRLFEPGLDRRTIEGLGDEEMDLVRLKSIVEVLGGRIWVDSEPGTGSIFSILLPVMQESGSETAEWI